MPRPAPVPLDASIDPDIAAVAARAEKYFALAADKAIAHTIDPRRFPVGRGTLEALLLQRLQRPLSANRAKGETRADLARAQAQRLAQAQRRWRGQYTAAGQLKSANRQYQSYLGPLAGAVRLDSARSIHSQLPPGYFFGGTPRLVERAKHLAFPPDDTLPPSRDAWQWYRDLCGGSDAASPSATQKTTLECVIREVNCIDETDGFLWTEAGSDEIRLGGLTVSPRAAVTRVAAFHVKDFDSDGDSRVYSPPDYKRFATFSLEDEGAWPRPFFATFVLAEKDMGGLGEFLSSLVDLVQAQLAVELAEAVGMEAAAVLLAAVGPGVVAAAIAVALMIVVFVVVLAVFYAIKRAWEDDVFAPKNVLVQLDSRSAANSFDWVSQGYWWPVNFVGHGGHYQLFYSWRSR